MFDKRPHFSLEINTFTTAMKKLTTLFLFSIIFPNLFSQVANTGIMDTTGGIGIKQLSIGGYIDTYYGGTFSKTSGNNIPYFVSMARNNEVNINLMYLDLRYHTKNFRARIVPGFGTYINANYASEPGSLKNIVEASAGFKISKKKDIWLDAGVLGSPYTNESAISKDQLVYTRSFAPEYVPYYLTGAKLTFPTTNKSKFSIYLINGWQQIQDVNGNKSLGTQLEFHPNKYALINWNTYIGNESSSVNPSFKTRYFSDVYLIYSKNKISASACVYFGNQTVEGGDNFWGQINVMGKYTFTPKLSLSGRLEYFEDKRGVQVRSVNNYDKPGSLNDIFIPFNSYSGSLCFNYKINDNALFRLEGRQFYSKENNYQDSNGAPSKNMTWLISNVTVWF